MHMQDKNDKKRPSPSESSFVSKVNPKPDPHDMSISTFKYESNLKQYTEIEKLAAVDHDQWHYWSQIIMRDMDETITALHDLDKRLLETTITYEKSTLRDRVKKLIAKHNERNARWERQWCAYKQLPEEVKEQDRIWAKKEWEAIHK